MGLQSYRLLSVLSHSRCGFAVTLNSMISATVRDGMFTTSPRIAGARLFNGAGQLKTFSNEQAPAIAMEAGFGTQFPAGQRLRWNRSLVDGSWVVSTVSPAVASIPRANQWRENLSSLSHGGSFSQRRQRRPSGG